jgi:integrase
MLNGFNKYLKEKNLSPQTIEAYLYTVEIYQTMYKRIDKDSVLSFKGYLLENFKVKTVNLRIQALNKYLEYLNKKELKVTAVKIQQKPFLENVISDADYEFLKKSLKKDKNYEWYFVVRFLAATGARVSELIQIKVEHICLGYLDLYSKGGKTRRIYIHESLKTEALKWLESIGRHSGYIFLNRQGKTISTRGISIQLKKLSLKYGINPDVVYPHSFRHRFAKNFIEKYNDISLLADLMGHDSIETTRIYLRRTSTEQREIVDKIVTW